MDSQSLAHTKWNCKYHIVFAPKYRRKEIYGKKKAEIEKILRDICQWKGVEMIKAKACQNRILQGVPTFDTKPILLAYVLVCNEEQEKTAINRN